MVHNGLTNLFNEMKYEINSTEVQRVKKPGITSAMKGYCSYSPADSNIMQNAAWDISGKNANFVKNNTFSGCIPLKHVFGFCDDYKRILVNCSQQLILNRSMSDLSSLHFTSVPGGDLAIESVQALVKKVKVQLTRMLWKVPVVKVDDHDLTGFGALLFQGQAVADNKMKPVFYFSQRTSPNESKFHSFELECLAVVYAIKRFHIYLSESNTFEQVLAIRQNTDENIVKIRDKLQNGDDTNYVMV
ncbi:hypothetical protein QTP88_001259 [Uroleucon formosanum]